MCEATNNCPWATVIAPWGRKWPSLSWSSSLSSDLVLASSFLGVSAGTSTFNCGMPVSSSSTISQTTWPAISRFLMVGSFLTHFSMALATASSSLVSMAHSNRSLVVVIGRL